ncbi:MAG: ImmA/IrrE family metallo-endopeptidase [Intestinibacter sp.]
MNLLKLIRQTENQGCNIIFLKDYKEQGRYLEYNSQHFIFINDNLSDLMKINVILHELAHFKNQDTKNSLSNTDSFIHHIENNAEKERIINLMTLTNTNYPIDETFNYLSYMKTTNIPEKYENLVKELAKTLYKSNKDKHRI